MKNKDMILLIFEKINTIVFALMSTARRTKCNN